MPRKTALRVEPFDTAPPEALQELCRFLEAHGLKTSGLFCGEVEKPLLETLSSRLERGATLGKEDSVPAAACMLDVMLNAMGSPGACVAVFFFDADSCVEDASLLCLMLTFLLVFSFYSNPDCVFRSRQNGSGAGQ